jgi:hypothetical protein
MKSKFLTFKILQRIIRKFPAIQWNRPNVILFPETIPLNYVLFIWYLVSRVLKTSCRIMLRSSVHAQQVTPVNKLTFIFE